MSISGIKTAAGVELWDVDNYGGGVTNETDPYLIPMVQYYTHFDLSTEQLGHTSRYNCWGFTFIPRRYWINSSSCVDQIINDNCSPVTPGFLKRGDVIRYRDDSGVTTHTGRVWEVDAAGNCTKVRSKWGGMGEYIHIPLEPYITPVYGTNLAYFRQHSPLKGIIGDLWLKDSPADSGNQYSGDTYWTSPDILVDCAPYGSVDENPKWGVLNRVWAVVHNRSEAAIDNVKVRYYWANPYAGFAPANWQLIPGTPVHPNPTNAFTIPGYSDYTADFVEWTPVPVPGVPDPAHQCLLAIAYVDDDPQNSGNPDPVVYSFDIPMDNNICLRNVHVISMNKGASAKLTLATQVPFNKVGKLTVNLHFTLKYLPRLPVFGIPDKIVAPGVKVSFGGQRPVGLTVLKRAYKPMENGPFISAKESEIVVAVKEINRLALVAKKSVPIALEITAPRNAKPGSNFLLNIEQKVGAAVTGGYTVVITIV